MFRNHGVFRLAAHLNGGLRNAQTLGSIDNWDVKHALQLPDGDGIGRRRLLEEVMGRQAACAG